MCLFFCQEILNIELWSVFIDRYYQSQIIELWFVVICFFFENCSSVCFCFLLKILGHCRTFVTICASLFKWSFYDCFSFTFLTDTNTCKVPKIPAFLEFLIVNFIAACRIVVTPIIWKLPSSHALVVRVSLYSVNYIWI